MCQFFSFDGDGRGNFLSSNWEQRKTNLSENWDSHTGILTRKGIPEQVQHLWSKYGYNPLTGLFTVDYLVEGHDPAEAERWVKRRDWKAVCEPLVIKKIKNPLRGKPKEVTQEIIELLKEWDSVWDSVRDFVGHSVWHSVRHSVGDSVRHSVGDSVRDSVWDSVLDSVRDSVRDFVWDSVWDSVWAYISSFFNIAYEADFSSGVRLWDSGFVPSFDGDTWRLHSGKKGKVVFSVTASELRRTEL